MTERAGAPNVASPGVRQDDVYGEVFARAASVLPVAGRLYVQTLVFGRNMVPIDAVSIQAPRGSDAWSVALM